MKKKTRLVFASVCIVLVLAASIILTNRPTPEDEMMDMLNRVANALGDEWKKQAITKVSDFVYSDGKGNTIIYYVCITTYYEADTAEQTGLNIDAISAIIPPDKAESNQECTVGNLPAAIYQKDGRAYLCWTIIPELSCVLEYDPTKQSEDDMLRMAESIPANQSQ